jgi:predicted dehydrogenase
MSRIDCAVIGGGMIVHDQILPSLWQLQRQGLVGQIRICARRAETLSALSSSQLLRRAFPERTFESTTDAYPEMLAAMPSRQLAVMALPDNLHFEAIMAALRSDLHVCAVKPLVMRVHEAKEIEQEASKRGLFVGIDYHKRFDDRSLMARRAYREGRFGEFRLGTACLLEKWYYRSSNFQNWFTTENSDAFTYIGCHYVDLVQFITGLDPAGVSVHGIRDRFPNGNEGFMWTDARVIWSNGACLNVQSALGFPDEAPGSNTQGITMYCSGGSGGAFLRHSDQYRGLEYSCLGGPYSEPSPDYFQYVDRGGPGLEPVGYGYRSIEAIVRAAIAGGDPTGIIATPANSRHNERVIEAGRISILAGGKLVEVA